MVLVGKDCFNVVGLLAAVLTFGACSASTTAGQQVLAVEMYGVPQTPAGASGTEDPRYEIYTLSGVEFSDSDGNLTTLYSGADAAEVRIVNRPQIIYSKDIADLNGNTYASAKLTFNATVSAASKTNTDELSFSLTNPSPQHSATFKVEEGKGLVIITKVKWKNTASDGAFSEPELSLSIDTE